LPGTASISSREIRGGPLRGGRGAAAAVEVLEARLGLDPDGFVARLGATLDSWHGASLAACRPADSERRSSMRMTDS